MPAAPAVPRTERRKFPRRDVIGSQLVSVDISPQSSSALLLDISEGGLALQNLTTMKPGGTREVSFRILEGDRIKASALVVWKDGNRAGLRLVRVDEASRSALRRWIGTLSELPRQDPVIPAHPDPRPQPVPAIPPPQLRDEDFYSITARARVVTCATGAAMAWRDTEGMVCRASTGLAPVTGARVQLDHGLSGECIRTRAIVRCDDTENDSRIDPEVCRQLNLRSAVIVPVLHQGRALGLIEVFSSKPNAFSNEDVTGLKLLAEQCSNGQVSTRPEPQEPEPQPVSQPEEMPLQGFGAAPQKRRFAKLRYRAIVPWVIGALVLVGGASLAFHHSESASAAGAGALPNKSQADLAAIPDNTAQQQPVAGIPRDVTEAFFGKGDAAARSVIRKQRAGKAEGTGTQSSEKSQSEEEDEVVVRQVNGAPNPPQQSAQKAQQSSTAAQAADATPPALAADSSAAGQSALAALNVPSPALPSGPSPTARTVSEVTPARLVRSVKPHYPTSARANKIQGPVSLRLKVDAFGQVREVSVISGESELARAAVQAVRQWRYEPFRLNGKPVDGETNVTVNFSIK